MAQARSGLQCVVNVRLNRIPVMKDCCHASLRPERGPCAQLAFGKHSHSERTGKLQGETHPGSAATNDQHVVFGHSRHV